MVCLSAWFWVFFVMVEIAPREAKTGCCFSMTTPCFFNTRWCCLFVLRTTGPCPVAQTCLKLAMLLPQTPEYWSAPSYPVSWVCMCVLLHVHCTWYWVTYAHFILGSNVLWACPSILLPSSPFQLPLLLVPFVPMDSSAISSYYFHVIHDFIYLFKNLGPQKKLGMNHIWNMGGLRMGEWK